MASNMRAYRDGNRMVLVIENPTQDLEQLIAAMLTGEISSVKGLIEPKPMAKPKLDVRQMEEIKPAATPNPAVNAGGSNVARQEEPRKAQFVKNLEASRQAAVGSGNPIAVEKRTAQAASVSGTNSFNNNVLKQTSNDTVNRKITITEATDTVPAEAKSNAVKPGDAVTEPAKKTDDMAKPAQINLSRAAMIRMVMTHREAPIVKMTLNGKYHNEHYPIEKLNDIELRQLVAALSRTKPNT